MDSAHRDGLGLESQARSHDRTHFGGPVVTDPFPHLVIDGYWNNDLLDDVVAEFPSVESGEWIRRNEVDKQVKLGGGRSLWGPRTQELATEIEALGPSLSELFALPQLTPDFGGGGYHYIEPGGHLAVHADFNVSKSGLYRRANVLVYLNHDWTEADGGNLELWNERTRVRSLLPTFNRTVAFETSDRSFHGHPIPLAAARPRLSFAGYFFSEMPPPDFAVPHSTVWRGPETETELEAES